MATVGVDVGGSGVRAAVVEGGAVIGAIRSSPLQDRAVETVCAAIADLVAPLGPSRVGVGMPGFSRDGRVLASPNFPSWRDVALGSQLEARLGVPVAVENDANAAALGAWRVFGGVRDLVLITLGTGVGGGVVSEGRLLRGRRGTAGELGHLFVGGDAPCGCGGRGCLETWSSTVGLRRLALEAGHEVANGAEVMRRAADGEAWAIRVREQASEALGRGLASLANTFAPEVLALAGGLATEPRHWARAVEVFEQRVIPANRCALTWLGRADELAIVGAAQLFTE